MKSLLDENDISDKLCNELQSKVVLPWFSVVNGKSAENSAKNQGKIVLKRLSQLCGESIELDKIVHST